MLIAEVPRFHFSLVLVKSSRQKATVKSVLYRFDSQNWFGRRSPRQDTESKRESCLVELFRFDDVKDELLPSEPCTADS